MLNVSQEQLAAIKKILAENVPQCEVRAFGSRVDGQPKSYSDLDLAIVGNAKIDSRKLRLLKEAFEESNLPFRVDVLDWHRITENFKKVIEKKFEVIQQPQQ